ncbi:MAG: site-2 protease family protein [Acidobacteriia bacterium]|nr:site-2 protease family protein [Terriglobia bacterium]
MSPSDNSGKPTPGSIGTIKIFGVPVRLHFTFVLLLIFLVAIGVGDAQSGPSTVIYVIALFVSVLLHELGHAIVARHYGIATLEIVMFPIGGISRPERPPKANEEMWIALAGPLVNLILGIALWFGVAARQGFVSLEDLRQPTDANLAERIAIGNLILCVFNLLPALPMDGGRILRALIGRKRPMEEATRVAALTGRALAVLMGLAGLLLSNFMLVFIALFVYLGAAQEGAAARGRMLSAGFPIRAAMITDFRTLQHGDTIRDAGNLLLATSQHDFPIMHGDQVTGLLTRARLVRAMMSQGADAYVAGAMDRDFLRLSPDAPLTEVLPQLSRTGACALVMDSNDHLLGMVTSENISEFLLLRQASVVQPSDGQLLLPKNDNEKLQ